MFPSSIYGSLARNTMEWPSSLSDSSEEDRSAPAATPGAPATRFLVPEVDLAADKIVYSNLTLQTTSRIGSGGHGAVYRTTGLSDFQRSLLKHDGVEDLCVKVQHNISRLDAIDETINTYAELVAVAARMRARGTRLPNVVLPLSLAVDVKMLMPMIPGIDLARIISSAQWRQYMSRLSEESPHEYVQVFYEGLRALGTPLAFIHSIPAVYVDCKPENFRLNPDTEEICLVDMSSALLLESPEAKIQPSSFRGTECFECPVASSDYLGSPEIKKLDVPLGQVSSRADTYSLGVCLVELLRKSTDISLTTPKYVRMAAAEVQKRLNSASEPGGAKAGDVLQSMLALNPNTRPTVSTLLELPEVKKLYLKETQPRTTHAAEPVVVPGSQHDSIARDPLARRLVAATKSMRFGAVHSHVPIQTAGARWQTLHEPQQRADSALSQSQPAVTMALSNSSIVQSSAAGFHVSPLVSAKSVEPPTQTLITVQTPASSSPPRFLTVNAGPTQSSTSGVTSSSTLPALLAPDHSGNVASLTARQLAGHPASSLDITADSVSTIPRRDAPGPRANASGGNISLLSASSGSAITLSSEVTSHSATTSSSASVTLSLVDPSTQISPVSIPRRAIKQLMHNTDPTVSAGVESAAITTPTAIVSGSVVSTASQTAAKAAKKPAARPFGFAPEQEATVATSSQMPSAKPTALPHLPSAQQKVQALEYKPTEALLDAVLAANFDQARLLEPVPGAAEATQMVWDFLHSKDLEKRLKSPVFSKMSRDHTRGLVKRLGTSACWRVFRYVVATLREKNRVGPKLTQKASTLTEEHSLAKLEAALPFAKFQDPTLAQQLDTRSGAAIFDILKCCGAVDSHTGVRHNSKQI